MILTVSDNVELCKDLHRFFLQKGAFSRFVSFVNLPDFVKCDTKSIDFAIIDGSSSKKDVRFACEIVAEYFPSAQIEIFAHIDQLKELFVNAPTDVGIQGLKVSTLDHTARLLGYPLRLTKNEYKILLLLLCEKRIFSADEILDLAFPFSENASKNQLAVHVCNINKKATLISGRRLIINPHKNGYTLNSRI